MEYSCWVFDGDFLYFYQCHRFPKSPSIFTVTHFSFLFLPCLTFTISGSYYYYLLFFFSFIFSHHAFSVFSSFTGVFSDSFDCWEAFFFSMFEGSYYPKVGNISFIFFWYVTGFDLASLTISLRLAFSSWDFFPITNSGKSPLSSRLKFAFVVNPMI